MGTNSRDELFVTPPRAAKILGVSVRTVQRRAKSGQWPFYRSPSGRILISVAWVNEQVRTQNKGEQTMFRQGDVLVRKINAVPTGERKVRKDGILAHGEVTGHAHKLAEVQGAELYDIGDRCFLSVTAEGGISIVHEEHGPQVIPPGDYEVTIQREYSPVEIRRVAD